ncbi:hypothetical protein SAMD00019534_044570 [Acytostelium subglobosum LB1]|uniref:hypothetical protein n=1 Tax=Acytostelium subglobosum LB1 TaxID=1410327 RepID=UPI000644B4A4|nr:hypothetical protein SAMD00019534_044570 [Acytostelium subglobosum LB1]GAM21282.1 hypothetical protein SAMD00019534_044570 [Acytostelium subglobosum LB1]|eukprot:XP_012755401.1 hypothetical protein SAMD00019534_044570 [Acytostelium subglobosum LB1]
MSSLRPGQQYCYRVGDADRMNNSNNTSPWSDWKQFTTVPDDDQSPVYFAAIADSGTYGNVSNVMKSLSSDPDITMVVHGGDLSYGLKDQVWELFGNIVEPVTSIKPFMVIPGNWDVKPDAIGSFLNRYKMPLAYPNPTTTLTNGSITSTNFNMFYALPYNTAYMIMLSSYDPLDKDSVQYSWLLDQLVYVNDRRDVYPWLVIFLHSPMYTSSQGHGGSDLKMRELLEPLLTEYLVNVVVSGHDHGYERTYPVQGGQVLNEERNNYVKFDGTIHVLAGTGGADLDPWMDYPSWTAHRESSVGYTKFKATYDRLDVTYLRVDGSTGDSFVLHRNSGQFRHHLRTKSDDELPLLLEFLILVSVVLPVAACLRICCPKRQVISNDHYYKMRMRSSLV